MDKKKKIAISISMILVVILLAVVLFYFARKNAEDDNVKIKKNVKIITSETKVDLQPIRVTENTILFDKNPKYKVGDVIVAGIIDSAPNGFIRKVVSVTEENGVYEYKTENAVLTDVFEEAHIIKIFAVTLDEVKDMEEIDNGVMSLNLSTSQDDVSVEKLTTVEEKGIDNEEAEEDSVIEIKPTENGLGLIVELEDEIGENVELNGEVVVNNYFEIKIDIEDGEVDFGIALHTDTSGELSVEYQKELFDKEDSENDGEYEKELLSNPLPNIEFLIGSVPVVVTNDFELIAAVSAQVEGQISTIIGIGAERISGFEYSSRTGDIIEINERTYLSDGFKWDTQASANGELEAGIYAHLITKLYGSAGADLSIGIVGNVEGELAVGINEKLETTTYGKLSLSIGPKASGKIVVTTPVVDYDLVEADLFEIYLPPFWEKEWELPDPMLLAMKNGNFSCFSGTYIATQEANDASGGGKNLSPLKLNKDGTVSGGGSHYSNGEIYPKTAPISVSKNEDGSYKCVWGTGTIYDPAFPDEEGSSFENYYTIYPIGVIEDNEYVREHQTYLKDVVYIHCHYVEGGVMDAIYYSDSIANVVMDYSGDDWVAQEAYTEEIGETLVSGTGIEYTVVATENNFNAGGSRTRIVLKTKDGKRWMIPNLPNFQYDDRTGIIYFDICEYMSDPDYVEYSSM